MSFTAQIKSEELIDYEIFYFDNLVKTLGLSSDLFPDKKVAWFITGDWKKYAGEFSRYDFVVVSIVGERESRGSLRNLFWNNVVRSNPANAKFLTHSPLSYRTFSQIQKMPNVTYSPLPFLSLEKDFKPQSSKGIAGMGQFKEENHFVFFLNVAHYLLQKKKDIHFSLSGDGPLESHYNKVAKELGIQSNVTVSKEWNQLPDVLLYTPFKNYTFIPILLASAFGLAVVGQQLPGIETFIRDAETGFLFETSDTKSAAELTIRLLEHEELRKGLSAQLKKLCQTSFSLANFRSQFEELLGLDQFKKTSQAA